MSPLDSLIAQLLREKASYMALCTGIQATLQPDVQKIVEDISELITKLLARKISS